jgi:Rnl2 family RNA ligase
MADADISAPQNSLIQGHRFTKYDSIENPRDKWVQRMFAESEKDPDVPFVVTEKVHGTNFSFHVPVPLPVRRGDFSGVRIAKRSSFLTDGTTEAEKFFGCQHTAKKYMERICMCASDVLDRLTPDDGKGDRLVGIVFYGELLGGSFHGFSTNNAPIQKRMHYTPSHEFYCFDVCLMHRQEEDPGTAGPHAQRTYLSHDLLSGVCEARAVLYAKELFRGSLGAALEWSARHKNDPTGIPDMLGLALPGGISEHCQREGHVIKPTQPMYSGCDRCIVKDKSDKFEERVFKKLTTSSDKLVHSCLEFLTLGRLESVMSKIPDAAIKEVVSVFLEDALQDIHKDDGLACRMDALSGGDLKTLTKSLKRACSSLVYQATHRSKVPP